MSTFTFYKYSLSVSQCKVLWGLNHLQSPQNSPCQKMEVGMKALVRCSLSHFSYKKYDFQGLLGDFSTD